MITKEEAIQLQWNYSEYGLTDGKAILKEDMEKIINIIFDKNVNLCNDCEFDFSTCESNPTFGSGFGNDNIVECDVYTQYISKK